MKRKDFLKSCMALGIVPFLPKIGKTKDKLIKPVYGTGYRHPEGTCVGLWHEDKGEIEMVFLDYRRVPIFEEKLKHYTGETPKERKEQHASDVLYRRLYDKMKVDLKTENFFLSKTDILQIDRTWRSRMLKWTKWLANHFEKIKK